MKAWFQKYKTKIYWSLAGIASIGTLWGLGVPKWLADFLHVPESPPAAKAPAAK